MATDELASTRARRPAPTSSAGSSCGCRRRIPVYDEGYQQAVETIRAWLAAEVPNVHAVGRNGMHKYNNQDHSMYTAMLTVENIVRRRAPRHLGR